MSIATHTYEGKRFTCTVTFNADRTETYVFTSKRSNSFIDRHTVPCQTYGSKTHADTYLSHLDRYCKL